MINLRKTTFSGIMLTAVLTLSACSSGGGSSPSSTAITAWPDPFASQQVSASGRSQTGTYYSTGTPQTSMGSNQSGATMIIKLATDGSVEYANMKPVNSINVVQDSSSSTVDLINASSKVDHILSSNSQNAVLLANPVKKQWEYQTYASWITGLSTNSGEMGAMSAGWQTSANNMPSTGTATYSGTASGIYQSSSQFYYTHADMSAMADFSARSINFQTVSTQKESDLTNTSSSTTLTTEPNLNLNGTLTWSSGSNSFTGNVSSAHTSGAYTGTVSGNFFGPSAEEIGGTFSLTNSGGSAVYQGAFGGKQ